MVNRLTKISLIGATFILAVQLSPRLGAGEAYGKGEQPLEALSLVLELTPDQHRQASETIKAGEAAKREIRTRVREKFGRLNEIIRGEAPRESDIRAYCREIGSLQEELIFRDAQTQVAFRKILDARQTAKLNRLEQLDPGVPGLGLSKGRGNWHPHPRKDD